MDTLPNNDMIDQVTKPNKKLTFLRVVLIALLFILVGGGVYLLLNLSKVSQMIPQTTNPPVLAKALDEAQITISSQGFIPATILVKKGTPVTWANTDKAVHQIVTNPDVNNTTLIKSDFSEPLRTSDTFTFTFDKEGTYPYFDRFNPQKLQGTVVVK